MTTMSFERAIARPRDPSVIRTGFNALFARPVGFFGWIVGWLMALTRKGFNRFVVERLALADDSDVLDVGAGPGVGVSEAARRAPGGRVIGVDHAELMVRHAEGRNHLLIAEGQVEIILGRAAVLPVASESIDRVMAVDAFPYWDDPFVVLCELRRVLRPGGRAALAVSDTGWSSRLVAGLRSVGFRDVVVHTHQRGVCVVGAAP